MQVWRHGTALISSALLTGLYSPAVKAQPFTYSSIEAAHIITGSEAAESLGYSVSGGGDINNDGFSDFIVGAPNFESRGRVFVLSGKTGQFLFEAHSFNPGATGQFGAAVAHAGDIDADGFSDWIVGDPGDDKNGEDSGQVFVFSGKDGSLLQTFHCDRMPGEACGAAIAGNCNYDGNAAPDFLISASGGGAGGKVYVYSGSSPEAIRSFESFESTDEFGFSLSCSGDFDGDARDDIAIGAPGLNENSGGAFIFSGRTGELLSSWEGSPTDRLAQAVAFVGDINGDGASDLMIGAPQLEGLGYVSLISSQTGAEMARLTSDNLGSDFGASLTHIGDVNQDSIPDLLVGDPRHSSGRGQVYIFSGTDQSLLYQFEGERLGGTDSDFGRSLYAAGDANADGIPDIIVGAPLNSAAGLHSGRAYLFYTRPKLIEQPPPGTPPGGGSDGNENEEPEEPEPEPQEPVVCPEVPELETIEDFIALFNSMQENFSDRDLREFQHYLVWLRVKRSFDEWKKLLEWKEKNKNKEHKKDKDRDRDKNKKSKSTKSKGNEKKPSGHKDR